MTKMSGLIRSVLLAHFLFMSSSLLWAQTTGPSTDETLQFIAQMTVKKARIAPPRYNTPSGLINGVEIDQDLSLTVSYKYEGERRDVVINFQEVDSIWYQEAPEANKYGGIEKGDHLVIVSCKNGSKCAAYFRGDRSHWFSAFAQMVFDAKSDANRTVKALDHLMKLSLAKPRGRSPF